MTKLEKVHLDEDEREYVLQAIKSGVQSTEILNVLLLNRLMDHNLGNLIRAMKDITFEPKPILPMEIQKQYTILKVEIKNAWRKSELLP